MAVFGNDDAGFDPAARKSLRGFCQAAFSTATGITRPGKDTFSGARTTAASGSTAPMRRK